MLVSVFTPSHRTERLDELYESLCKQTHKEWERVVLLNNGAHYTNSDPRVKIHQDEYIGEHSGYIGRLKLESCKLCKGEWLVEVDHDDLLTPTALEEISKVPKAYDFCYSNTVNITRPQIEPISRSPYYGWTYRPFVFMGKEVVEAISAKPFPQSISRIWFAPNHLRAWRKKFYNKIGGHNPDMKITDDHDLMMRTYISGQMYHIDKPLYIYRVRGDNTRQQNMDDIDFTMWQCHDKYFRDMMYKWSKSNGLRTIDLGGAIGSPQGYESVDRHNADIVCDLNLEWSIEDNSVGIIRAHDVIEHLKDPIHTMNEAYRVLAHGGMFMILVPSSIGIVQKNERGEDVYYGPTGATCDPTHISFWNPLSFRYYTDPFYRKYIEPECTCKFQEIKRVHYLMGGIPYCEVQLMADKGGERFYGENNRN